MPNTQQLIDALKQGKRIRYTDNAERPDQFVVIEPFQSDFDLKGGMGFHFYGWGAAYWRNQNVFQYICLFPENFEVMEHEETVS